MLVLDSSIALLFRAAYSCTALYFFVGLTFGRALLSLMAGLTFGRALPALGIAQASLALLSLMAGLLTFPSLLYLPDFIASGVIQAGLSKGDYSCRYSSGLSPDSLTSGGYSHQIAIFDCKDTTFFDNNAYFPTFFLILQHEITISHRSTNERFWQNNDCQRADGLVCCEGNEGAAVQVRP